MSFLTSDPLNCEIIALSLGLQREISRDDGPEGPKVGAQQIMPRPEHIEEFGPKNPLPWVPDRVGAEFSRENNGVLVVGSSYNGFIEGYSQRNMALADYLSIRNLIHEGNGDPAHRKVKEACTKFSREFEAQVVEPDEKKYYGPIRQQLLGNAGVPESQVCLTDLCKASFVERGSGGVNRGDNGKEEVIKMNWLAWTHYLTCTHVLDDTPLPYQWIWARIQQCRHIVALGYIAEYGVLKIFRQMADAPTFDTLNGGRTSLKASLHPDAKWKYSYASNRQLSHWLGTNDAGRDRPDRPADWWTLSDGATGKKWNLLPVYHPAFSSQNDPGYERTRPVLATMIEASSNARTRDHR